ncbi:MAG: cytochrome B [candidate division Zixibacteria bacterium]|nr:cytochrome B [candidate division Zixibacteria bacterium]
MSNRIYIYKGFERFWHWGQALLVILLLYTGFEIHGTLGFIGYEQAVNLHNKLVWALLVLISFAIFWHFTTGEWKQYIPTVKKLNHMIRYYLVGIFRNEPHPTRKTELSKLNPLQRITYLSLKILIFPVQIISGFAYYYYNELSEIGINISLGAIAFVHTAAAFVMLVFLIGHVYLTTTGHTVFSNIKAMITGWEDLEDEEKEPYIQEVKQEIS